MAFSLIAESTWVAADDNPTTANMNTVGADLFIAIGVNHTSGSAPTGPSDTQSNTWNGLTVPTLNNNARCRIFYATNVGSKTSSTHQFTYSGTFILAAWKVLAFSGAHLTAPFDVEAAGNSIGSGTTIQPGSLTPSQDGSLIIQACGIGSEGVTSFTINGGYSTATFIDANNSSGRRGGGSAWLEQGSASATNPTWTSDTLTSLTAVAAAFKPASAGGLQPGQAALVLAGQAASMGFAILMPDEP